MTQRIYFPAIFAMVIKRILISTVFLAIHVYCVAQGGHLFLEHYGETDGLTSSTIWKILKDDQGFLWLATDDGLVRYDGLEFKVFRSEVGDTTGFEHRNVFDVVKNNQGQLLAIAKNSLVRLDPRDLRIRRIQHQPAGFKTDIPNVPRLLALGIDHSNNTWVCSSYGVFVLSSEDVLLKYIRIPDTEREYEFNTCRGIVFDNHDFAWVSTAAGMVRIHTKDYSLEKWNVEDRTGLDRGLLFSEGKVWAFGQQLYCFDTTNPLLKTVPETALGGYVFGITENPRSKGEFWLANRYGGVQMYNANSAKWDEWCMHRDVDSDSPIYATQVYFDEEAMWIATHHGLYRTVLADKQIHTTVLSEASGIAEHGVYNLFPDDLDSSDWTLLNTTDGLFAWNFNTGEFRKVPPRTNRGMGDPLVPNFRFQISPEEEFWSVGFQGLYRCKGERCELVIADSIIEPGNRDWRWFISNVRRDGQGRFWVAAESKLALIDGEDIQFFTPPAIIDERGDTLMAKASFNQFIFDKHENIWIISDFSMQKHLIGLYRFDTKAREFEFFCHHHNPQFPDVENIFNHALIGDQIWCTTSSGIIRFNPYDEVHAFDLVTYNDWLPTSGCFDIQPGPRNEAWITTSAGLIRWRADDNVRIFKRTDGFFENNPGNLRRGADGRFYLFSEAYVTWFYPDSLRSNRKSIQPYLTRVLVNSAEYVSDIAPPYLSELNLKYDENTLAFSFSALDFAKTKNLVYSYKLEGSDQDWIETSSNSIITLSNLDGGNYVFKVRVRYSDEDWSDRMLVLKIHIQTAWFMSWWFFTMIGIVVACFIYFLARFRLNQLLRLHKVRNRIATDLHDDVGSALSSLVLYSDLLSRTDMSEDKQREIASKIRETAHDSVESMRDIVWSIKSTNDDFDTTQKYMQRLALDMVEPAGIAFNLESDPSLSDLKLSMEIRKNLILIFKESINNARKYSGADRIIVRLYKEHHALVMEIEDNGKGIDLSAKQPDSHAGTGNGIPNMRKRAAELNGKFSMESERGRGTRIMLKIPLTHH